MTEEIESTGTLLEHRIAQTKTDIETIDEQVIILQSRAEGLRVTQEELRKLLTQLEK